MLFFHKVELKELPNRHDPLYVGHFFPLTGMWWKKRKQRQEMIFSVAITWYRFASKRMSAPGMLSDELNLTGLTKQVRDARSIIEHFFTITKLGFNFNDGTNFSPTVVSPKKLPKEYIDSIEKHLHNIVFDPGKRPPGNFKITNVKVRTFRADVIRARLKEEGRDDLLPATNWLLGQESVEFMYRASGKLQARETSVWPIRAIELWPGWLRTELFGTTIDLENSFCQYMLSKLQQNTTQKMLELKYPDLLRAVYDKQKFREEICRDVLKRPPHDENISIVKRILMALANGSNCTAGLMASDSRSEVVRIIKQAAPDLRTMEMIEIGDRLQYIAKQFRAARRELAIINGMKPTRENLKKVFHDYFEWEKEARNKIWKVIGQTGLMLHDGIDGAVTDMSDAELADHITKTTNLRVSVESPA
jgi:hypothetical protein